MALFSIIFHIVGIFWIFIPKMGISHRLDSVILESFPTSGILGFKTVKPCRELILIEQKNPKILVENEAKREGENSSACSSRWEEEPIPKSSIKTNISAEFLEQTNVSLVELQFLEL